MHMIIQNYIHGEWKNGQEEETLDSTNPADASEVIGVVAGSPEGPDRPVRR